MRERNDVREYKLLQLSWIGINFGFLERLPAISGLAADSSIMIIMFYSPLSFSRVPWAATALCASMIHHRHFSLIFS